MSTDSPPADGPADDGPADDRPDAATDDAAEDTPSRAELAARVDELEAALSEATDEDGPKKMSIIATKGTLDMAYRTARRLC